MVAFFNRISCILNYLRCWPVWICYLCQNTDTKKKIKMDLDRWRDVTCDNNPEKNDLVLLNHLLMTQVPFRNLIQRRFRTPPYSFKNIFAYSLTKLLWRPDSTLHINTFNIGGGLFIQHGFATIIDAERIGENCWINQQVTIGFSGTEHPVLEDNVTVHCGAVVIGGITMHKNSVAAANAAVVKDVPENAVVGGVPAKIIKYRC